MIGTVGRLVVRHPIAGRERGRPHYSYTTPDGKSYPFNPNSYWRQTYLNPYIQDDWKISKRLTLNIGVRYEYASNPTKVGEPVFVFNNLLSPNTTEDSFIAAAHPFTSNPNIKNIDPRIGLAWDPFGNHKTSIRAGFGIFHEPVTARTFALDNTSMRPNVPLFFNYCDQIFPICLKAPATRYSLRATGPVPADQQIAWYYAILQNVDTAPYIMQYNLNIQRELGAGTVLTVGYNGSAGAHLFYWIDANPPLAYGDLCVQAARRTSAVFAGTGATGQGPRGTVTNPFVGMHANPNFQAVEAVDAHCPLQLQLLAGHPEPAVRQEPCWAISATPGPSAWITPRPPSARNRASGPSIMPTTRARIGALQLQLQPGVYRQCHLSAAVQGQSGGGRLANQSYHQPLYRPAL